MNDRILQKYTARKSDETADLKREDAGEEADDLGAFGWLRGVRDRAIMLELRKKNGNVKALGFAWISEADFDPSEGITLHHAGDKIRVIGRNLNVEIRPNVKLFNGIARHRVPWIQEMDEAQQMKAKEGDVIIERIEW